jgi:DNA polymerase IV
MNEKIQWLLVDLNSYFASCEQQDNPSLRGKPVAVVPMITDSTSVIAASFEAKLCGIKTGTRVSEAKKMCPGIQFISGGHKKYIEYHHKIIDAIDEICPVEKVLSIDEMACRLLGRECELENAIIIAKKIKQNIIDKVGVCMTTSVGLGPNILIAKIASDMMKPNGLVSIPKDQISEMLGPLDIDVIPGVGRNNKYKLNSKGFYKVQDLINISENELRRVWGSIWGLRVGLELRGQDIELKKNETRSYSHEHVLSPDLRNTQGAYQILAKLLFKGAQRVRKKLKKMSTLGVYVKYVDHTYFEKSIQFQETDDTNFLLTQLKMLYPFQTNKKPVKVGVVMGGLSSSNDHQFSFFDDPKNDRMNKAMDVINEKFGPNTLISGSFLNVTQHAKVKIAFNHIPTKDDEF